MKLLLLLAALLSMATAQVNVTFLHINDHHSHLVDENLLDLEGPAVPAGLSVNTSEIRIFYGGFPRMVTLIKTLGAAAEANGDEICVLHAGDGITGTPYYSAYGPEADAAAMSLVGFDAFVVGNHEFDDGDAVLANFSMMTDVPFLSYNLNPAETSALRELEGTDAEILPYLLKNLTNGDQMAICGITTKTTTELASQPDVGTTLDVEADAAAACVAEVEALGVNKIVILAHTGYTVDLEIYASIPGVDVVVGGHSHSLLGDTDALAAQGLTPAGPYATVTDSGVCVVTAWEFSKVVGELRVEFDEAGVVTSCLGGPRLALNGDFMQVRDAPDDADDTLSEADRAVVIANLTSFPHWVVAAPDAEVQAALEPFITELEPILATPIAPVPENICHTRRGDGIDEQCPNKPEISLLNGGVCPLVAQGFLFNALTADFALQNAGGCRTDILLGELTLGEAIEVLPFANSLVTLRLTGEQIVRALEDGLSFYLDIMGGSGSFPNTAGLRYSFDLTAEKGSRVSDIEMNPRLEGEWEPLDLEGSFIVVTTNFLATPRDGYDTLGEVNKDDPDQYVDLGIAYDQSFINFVTSLGTVEEVAPDTYPLRSMIDEEGNLVEFPTTSSTMPPTDAPTGGTSSGAAAWRGGAALLVGALVAVW